MIPSSRESSRSSLASNDSDVVILVHSDASPLTANLISLAEEEQEEGSTVLCIDARDKRFWPALSALDVPLNSLPSAWKVRNVQDVQEWLIKPKRSKRTRVA